MKNDKYPNVLCFLEQKTQELYNDIALGLNTKVGWRELTFGGLGILSKNLASYLIQNGVNKGDKISIISESNPEWAAVLFGAVLAGARLVPIDVKLTIYEMNTILSDCRPKILVVSNKFLDFAKQLQKEVDSIEKIIIINETSSDKSIPNIYDMNEYKDMKWRHRGLNKTALIIYTSGTTGKPKGVEITYKNMLSQVRGMQKCFHMKKSERLLSILPMNHLFELTVGFLSSLNSGITIYYPQNLKPSHIFHILKEKKISFMVVVPAFLKLIKTEIESDLRKRSALYNFFFGIRYQIARFIPFYRVRRLMFHNITKKLGGHFKGCISGGAPLNPDIANFINIIGINVYEGYGLSETSPIVSMSTKKYNKIGYVGKAIDGVSIKTDPQTGELLVKGENVMKGYYHQEELTATVIDADGWLHTGDIAEITKDGYLKITGRIKNMIVLSGGKKVFPEEIEAVLEKSPLIKEACVFGDKRKGGQKDGTEYVTVVVVPSDDVLEKEDCEQLLQNEVKSMSQQVAQYKRPTRVIISKSPFPRTATNKVKRKEIKESYT